MEVSQVKFFDGGKSGKFFDGGKLGEVFSAEVSQGQFLF